MVKVEITNDTAEALFKDILLQDYHTCVSSINELESRESELEPHEAQDLANDLRFKTALENMMEYYLTDDQRREAIGK